MKGEKCSWFVRFTTKTISKEKQNNSEKPPSQICSKSSVFKSDFSRIF